MSQDLTVLFNQARQGDSAAAAELTPKLHAELRRAAARLFHGERSDHTLQPTALVSEVYLLLSAQGGPAWNDSTHFFRLASQMMRRLLVDHARAKSAQKRGGDVQFQSFNATRTAFQTLPLAELIAAPDHERSTAEIELDFVLLDQALEDLAKLSARQAEVIQLRFFGSLSIDETAQVMSLSPATIKREWTMARLFLEGRMEELRAAQ